MLGYCAGRATTCFNSRPAHLAFLLTAISLLTLGCAPRSNWEEEVTIAPGETVIVEREARFDSSGAIGSPKFTYPTRQTLRVKSRIGSSEELKTAPRGAVGTGPTGDWVSSLDSRAHAKTTLRPLYLHRDENRQLVMVARFYFCKDWSDFKWPSPPYLAFRWTGKTWESVPVPDDFWERDSNLLANPGPNTGLRWSVADVAKRNKNAWEYDAKLRNVPLIPNCGMYASDELQKYRRK